MLLSRHPTGGGSFLFGIISLGRGLKTMPNPTQWGGCFIVSDQLQEEGER